MGLDNITKNSGRLQTPLLIQELPRLFNWKFKEKKMKSRFFAYTLANVAGIAITGSACAAAQRAVPSGVQSVEVKRFAQQEVGDCGTVPLNWEGVTFSYTQEGLELKGLNKHGSEWKTSVPATLSGESCEEDDCHPFIFWANVKSSM
jgi:hypothetical protein